MKDIFNRDDLHREDLQFQVRHFVANRFSVGESVFLKSNPEYPAKVHSISEVDNHVLVQFRTGYVECFPPECLLQYQYRGLLTYKDKWNICLN